MARHHRQIATTAVVALAFCAFLAEASAHGGAYQPPPAPNRAGPSVPPDIRRGPTTPGGSNPVGPTTPNGGSRGPTTPSGGVDLGGPAKGPTTGGGSTRGPTTGAGGVPTPTTGGNPFGATGRAPPRSSTPSVSMEHWTRWWYPNRRHIIAWSTRVSDRNARDATPGGEAARGLTERWRAEVQIALHEALEDRNEDLASGAAIALGKLGDSADAGPLARLLADSGRLQPVREAAAMALGLLPPDGGPSADVARQALEDVADDDRQPERLRAVAAYALGMRGELGSLPILMDLAHRSSASWDVPTSAVAALGIAGHDLVQPDLVDLLRGPRRGRSDEFMRRTYAAQALARFDSPNTLAALRDAATDSDVDVRRAAALSLGALESAADDETMTVLARMLARDRDTGAQSAAAIAIGRLGHERGEAALRLAYLKGGRGLRPFAALALGLYARHPGHAGAADILVRDLGDISNADERSALAIAVGLAGNIDAAPVLRDIVANRGDPGLRGHAAVALGLLDDRLQGAPLLRELLVDVRDPSLQREVALALGMLGDTEAVRDLIALVEDGTTVFVQGSAAVALGGIGGDQSGRALLDMLRDAKRPQLARAMAAVGLGLLLDPTEGRRIAEIGADLNWTLFTPTVHEILTIL